MAGPYTATHTVRIQGDAYVAGNTPTNLEIIGFATGNAGTITDGGDDNWQIDEDVLESPLGSSNIFFSGDGDTGDFVGTVEVNGTDYPVFYDGFLTFYQAVFDNLNDATAFANGPTAVTLTTSAFPACFAEGTQIATDNGNVAVEDLQIGTKVQTSDGQFSEVKWVGHQDLFPSKMTPDMQPVRIRAGALGDNRPSSDLILTADHAVYIDGYLVNAGALINGDTIDLVPLSETGMRVRVYHVETHAHEIIIANGMPSESYLDIPNRQNFANFETYIALYGEETIIHEMSVPRVSASRMLPPSIRALIATDKPTTDLAKSA